MLRRDTPTAAATWSAVAGKQTAAASPKLDPGIAPVQRELERLGANAVGSEGGPEVVEECAVLIERVRVDALTLPMH